MVEMERAGEMKTWMRNTVVWGDLLVWVSAVIVYCRANFVKGEGDKGMRPVVRSVFISPERNPDLITR
jgi:alpha-1,3-glucosyltransferase